MLNKLIGHHSPPHGRLFGRMLIAHFGENYLNVIENWCADKPQKHVSLLRPERSAHLSCCVPIPNSEDKNKRHSTHGPPWSIYLIWAECPTWGPHRTDGWKKPRAQERHMWTCQLRPRKNTLVHVQTQDCVYCNPSNAKSILTMAWWSKLINKVIQGVPVMTTNWEIKFYMIYFKIAL